MVIKLIFNTSNKDLTNLDAVSILLNPPEEKHIALIYENKEQLNPSIAMFINEGLKRGQFCVYATVYYRDAGHIAEFAAHINNYEENVKAGNLLIVDLAPFYISALTGNMTPFDEAKKLFTEKAMDRTDKHIRFVGDGTGFLFKNRHFDQCAMVEEWWQEKQFPGSYVCPYEKKYIDGFPHEIHSNRSVIDTHDIIVNAVTNVLEYTANEAELNISSEKELQDEITQGHKSNTSALRVGEN
jgi:hypothetical protein